MVAGNTCSQAQSQARAGRGSAAVETVKRLDGLLNFLRWDADTIVADAELGKTLDNADAHLHSDGRPIVAQGVLDKVHEHLRDELAVAICSNVGGRHEGN